MKCDREDCTEEATSFGHGFESGKSVSARCRNHLWTHDERCLLRASAARSRAAYESLSKEEQDAFMRSPPEDREALWAALTHKLPEA